MIHFTPEDIRDTLMSVPLSQVEKECRARKISLAVLRTILTNGRYTYKDFEKIVEICKEINTEINWDFPTLREVRDFFYTQPFHALPKNLELSLFYKGANPTVPNYYKICEYYFQLKKNNKNGV